MQSIFHKLHVHSRLEAAAFAIKHDMFEPPLAIPGDRDTRSRAPSDGTPVPPPAHRVGRHRLDPADGVDVVMRCDVMIADDRALFRDAMRTLMEAEDDMRVVAELESAADVVSEANRSRPDVALLNAELPGSGPIGAG